MKIFDRYIAWQIFVSAFYAVAVIIIILVLGNVFKEILRELAKRPELDFAFVLEFILLVIPFSLGLAVPFSFLTAILLVFGRLSADSEFVSMRMAGLSMSRICLPVALLAVVFTVLCGVVNLSVTPWAKTRMEGLKSSFFNQITRDPMLIFEDRQVMDDLPGHLVYAEKEDGILKNFQMVKMDGSLPEMFAVAEQAEVLVELDGPDPALVLAMENVNLMVKGQGTNFMDTAQPVFMEEAPASVSVARFKTKNEGVGDQPENISLRRLFGKLADDTLRPELRATYRTELSMRAAFSVSCLAFGLIGVPLGITAQRRESSTGFILALVIAVTYYTLLTFASMQREDESFYPHLLVWMPNILCFALGLHLFRKLSRK